MLASHLLRAENKITEVPVLEKFNRIAISRGAYLPNTQHTHTALCLKVYITQNDNAFCKNKKKLAVPESFHGGADGLQSPITRPCSSVLLTLVEGSQPVNFQG